MNRPYLLRPDDVRHQDFAHKMRGYDPQQVRSFLEDVADQIDQMGTEVKALKDRLALAQRESGEYRQIEDSIKAALIEAQRAADEKRRAAEAEATDIIARAHVAAETAAAEIHQRVADLRSQIGELESLKARMVSQIETLLNSQLDHLRMIQTDLVRPQDEEEAPEAPPVMAHAETDNGTV